MATDIRSDVHSLSVVRDRINVCSPTGTWGVKESWLKVKLDGAEGSIAHKFALLYRSAIQFKINLNERDGDAKGGSTYYPRGSECAQLFSVLADYADVCKMDGFSADKWAVRFPIDSLAQKRLLAYSALVKTEADKAKAALAAAQVPAIQDAHVNEYTNRMEADKVPVKNGKKTAKV